MIRIISAGVRRAYSVSSLCFLENSMNAINHGRARWVSIATLVTAAVVLPAYFNLAASAETPAPGQSTDGNSAGGYPMGGQRMDGHAMNPHGMVDGHPQVGEPDGATPDMMQYHHRMMMEMHGKHSGEMENAIPAMPGQDAFGAIQEIVGKLDADPTTDWSKVDLEALRQHLIDMNEVTLKAEATATAVDGGLAIAVTGSGRTLAAIQRMVPAHAQEIDGFNNWHAGTERLANGVMLTVTSTDPKEAQRIRGLGFIGILVSGSHHRPHHLAMAKGQFPHAH
jgi:hypothetical protein